MIQCGVLGGCVIIAVNLSVFKIFVVVQPAKELGAINVIVSLALGFIWAPWMRGDRNGVPNMQLLSQAARNRALADARRAAEDDEKAEMGVHFAHSYYSPIPLIRNPLCHCRTI